MFQSLLTKAYQLGRVEEKASSPDRLQFWNIHAIRRLEQDRRLTLDSTFQLVVSVSCTRHFCSPSWASQWCSSAQSTCAPCCDCFRPSLDKCWQTLEVCCSHKSTLGPWSFRKFRSKIPEPICVYYWESRKISHSILFLRCIGSSFGLCRILSWFYLLIFGF